MAKPTIPAKISDGTVTGTSASDSATSHRESEDEALVSAMSELKDALFQPQTDRASYVTLLFSVGKFVNLLWGDTAEQRLRELAFALSDLDQGTVTPLLAPTRVRARPPDSTAEWIRRVHMSLALECCVKRGEDIQIAASRLAYTAQVEPRKLINWRRQFQAGRVKNRHAKLFFDRLSQEIGKLDRENLGVIAMRFMNFSRRPI